MLTAWRRVRVTGLLAAPHCAALVPILTNERPRLQTGPVSLIGRQWPDLNLVFSIATHSKGEEARKLEDIRRVSRKWTIEDGSWGFLHCQTKRYNLMD